MVIHSTNQYLKEYVHAAEVTDFTGEYFGQAVKQQTGGVFPATGLKESGSAEGHIFCAKCDADFSVIDGKNHGGGSKNLIKVISTVSSSKDEAYILKNGQMPYSAL